MDIYFLRTVEFIERVQKARGFEEVKRLVLCELAWYGLTHVTSWRLPRPNQRLKSVIDLNTRPPEYVERYEAKNYVLKDPVITELLRSLAPFTWRDVQLNRRLSRGEIGIIDEAREFGANDGIIIPIVSAEGTTGVFSPCGNDPNLSERARAALEIVGIYSHHALQRALAEHCRSKTQQRPALTSREREIIQWVAMGKSDDEIGDILGISHETVKTHINHSKQKLNAGRRTLLVVEALRCREIFL